jgi:diguanylate cyclase (GGDEF)-like protein
MTNTRGASLNSLLDQSQQATEKIERAAVELSSLNAELQTRLARGIPAEALECSLTRTEAIEVDAREAADELAMVNASLRNEINEHQHLEDQLATSEAALSASRATERSLIASALQDGLTGLGNLMFFEDKLRRGLARAERCSARLAVMFIGLDHFRRVNDAYGHDFGDQVLKMVAQRLTAIVAEGDTVCRRSGSEFLFLTEARDIAGALAFATRITQSIGGSYELNNVKLTLRASVGIAVYPEDGRSGAELLRSADWALYDAKRHELGAALYRRASGQ